MKVQLVSPLPDRGFAFNEGIYWPLGLLTIATTLRRQLPGSEIQILDESLIGAEALDTALGADVVGIQASSSLTYPRVLEIAARAKAVCGAFVILGGPYAGLFAEHTLAERPFVDAVVDGPGELPMLRLVEGSMSRSQSTEPIPGVTLRGGPRGHLGRTEWNYEAILPLDYSLVPLATYHRNYQRTIGREYDGAFQIFTHFGCKFRDSRRLGGKNWCTYCALGEPLTVRHPKAICDEIENTLASTGMKSGSRLMLKCYGDNASALGQHLTVLAEMLKQNTFLRKFDLAWSVYGQSCYITPRLADTFARLGVAEVYVGFDSADDGIQTLNGLGTSRATHVRAATLLKQRGIRIQAGFVLGCEGESLDTLNTTMRFCEELQVLGNVDLFHASPMVVLAGSAAFDRLARFTPEMLSRDYTDPSFLQRLWLERFCPLLGGGEEAQQTVMRFAASMAALGRLKSGWGGAGTEQPTTRATD